MPTFRVCAVCREEKVSGTRTYIPKYDIVIFCCMDCGNELTYKEVIKKLESDKKYLIWLKSL